jgi:hypothetical protein
VVETPRKSANFHDLTSPLARWGSSVVSQPGRVKNHPLIKLDRAWTPDGWSQVVLNLELMSFVH